MAKLTLDKQATRHEAVDQGAVAYLLVVTPDGRAGLERIHPNGDGSAELYGSVTAEARALTEIVRDFRAGSSYRGEW